jgi:hypothetical protein
MQAERGPAAIEQPGVGQPPVAVEPRHRYDRWLVLGTGVLVLLAAGLTITVWALQQPPAPSPSARQAVPSPVWSTESPGARLARLRKAVVEALQGYAPGADLGLGDDTYRYGAPPFPTFEVIGSVRAGGRVGTLRVLVSRDVQYFPWCDGYEPGTCRTEDRGGGRIRLDETGGPVGSGQPRAIQRDALMMWSDGSWVQVTIDNTAFAWSPEQPAAMPPYTGQDPPLTVDQVGALAADVSMDVCDPGCEAIDVGAVPR